jgi:hypothetical protein
MDMLKRFILINEIKRAANKINHQKSSA